MKFRITACFAAVLLLLSLLVGCGSEAECKPEPRKELVYSTSKPTVYVGFEFSEEIIEYGSDLRLVLHFRPDNEGLFVYGKKISCEITATARDENGVESEGQAITVAVLDNIDPGSYEKSTYIEWESGRKRSEARVISVTVPSDMFSYAEGSVAFRFYFEALHPNMRKPARMMGGKALYYVREENEIKLYDSFSKYINRCGS